MKQIGIVAITYKAAAMAYQRIVQEGLKKLKGSHPSIIIDSASYGAYGVALQKNANGDPQLFVELILAALARLHKAGVDFAIVPNNSAHTVLTQINKNTPIPITSIIDCAVDACKEKRYQAICLMGPTPVIRGELFEKPLKNAAIECVKPTQEEQDLIHRFIVSAGENPEVNSQDIKAIQNIFLRLKAQNHFNGFLVACSELTNILPESFTQVSTLNPFELLADKALAMAIEHHE